MGPTCVCHMTETQHQQRGQGVAQAPQDTEHQPGGGGGQRGRVLSNTPLVR